MNSCRKHPKRYRKKGLRNDGRPQRKLGNIGGRSKLSQIDADKLIEDIAGGVAVTIACAAQGSALSITYATKGTIRHPVIWPICRHWAGSTSI
jgi:hypothetical protein